jgi:hypothetical protein
MHFFGSWPVADYAFERKQMRRFPVLVSEANSTVKEKVPADFC